MTKVDLDIYMKNLFNDCYVVNCNYLKNSFYFCNSKSEIRKRNLTN